MLFKNETIKAIMLCLLAMAMATISIFTTDTSITRAIYIAVAILFFCGLISNIKKYIKQNPRNK